MSSFSASELDAGVSVFMFLEQKKFQGMYDHEGGEGLIVFQIFDSNGQVHGRKAFDWILELPGAIDSTREGHMLEVIKTQGLSHN